MKASKATIERIREFVSPLDTEDRRIDYIEGRFPRADTCGDLDLRYRWDLLWATVPGSVVCDLYDEGLDDRHIDTVLRRVVPSLGV